MPMFAHTITHLIDRGGNAALHVSDCFEIGKKLNRDRIESAAALLKGFSGRAFGHFTYLPEYAEAIQKKPTRVFFNVRDPRDVIISELETARRDHPDSKKKGGVDLWSTWGGYERHLTFSGPDPIAELIEVAAGRWLSWLGWLDHDFVMKVKYEDLRLRKATTIKKIKEFCPHSSSASKMAKDSMPGSTNPTFRKGKVGEWKRYFEPHHKELVEHLMGEIFEKLEYEL